MIDRHTPRIHRLVLLSLVALAAAATASSAHADRRTGLAGSRLIQDRDDVFVFPQRALDYRNAVDFDYGAATGSGNGLALLGSDDFAFGVAVHRGDLQTPDLIGANTELAWLGPLSNPLLAPGLWVGLNGEGILIDGITFDATAPLTTLDLMIALPAGPGAFGARLGIGNNADFTDPPPDAAGNDLDEQGATQTFFSVGLGYTLEGDLHLDVALDLLFNLAEQVANGDTAQSGLLVRPALSARGFAKLDDDIDLGFLANAGFISQSVTNESVTQNGAEVSPQSEQSASAFGLQVGAGPVYYLDGGTSAYAVGDQAYRNDRARVALYGTLGLNTTSVEPDSEVDDDGASSLSVLAPGVHIAFETPLTSWLYVRSGMQYTYSILLDTQETTNGDLETSARASNFLWNAGLGIAIDSFRFDGAFSHQFLTQGPDFIGGDSPLFLMASAAYLF